ncbi:TPM domain-containing protein [Pedobacter sp. MC2016-05]|uniref:TPM domain-containing protein n=1 Tax=Pedobacter sp. MC2016-05 TaxID=2994474 RepID=UPI002246D225|nr:TPM domain-containing protein [Pedobacter sp. MC2016-05]
MKFRIFHIFVLLITLICTAKAEAQVKTELSKESVENYRKQFWDSIPKPKGWVNDYEQDFTPKQIASLDSTIVNFMEESSIQIAIVTVDSLMTSKKKFNDLALKIANQWGVGEKVKDNGILFAFSKLHRQIRIVNGYGIEKLISDRETKEIIENTIIPYFKKDDYYTGTFNGLSALIKLLKTKN